ncbi:uncharacterized protein C8Q71DRAFT_503821 [Rhodofomes roseus]|uniref:Uncharacterized protein n=1 Tax=Rhodofomes roseus TaxID=34475 RepID=A0ABQ8KMF8_9APHY|nr:uncharacterized protein C8Q71DRAFT_503821 [Rhodofomes roseus]KAH9839233.1 hypothetical protein C8Q71DRAFT_503821 [Rhodofomes roseus]
MLLSRIGRHQHRPSADDPCVDCRVGHALNALEACSHLSLIHSCHRSHRHRLISIDNGGRQTCGAAFEGTRTSTPLRPHRHRYRPFWSRQHPAGDVNGAPLIPVFPCPAHIFSVLTQVASTVARPIRTIIVSITLSLSHSIRTALPLRSRLLLLSCQPYLSVSHSPHLATATTHCIILLDIPRRCIHISLRGLTTIRLYIYSPTAGITATAYKLRRTGTTRRRHGPIESESEWTAIPSIICVDRATACLPRVDRRRTPLPTPYPHTHCGLRDAHRDAKAVVDPWAQGFDVTRTVHVVSRATSFQPALLGAAGGSQASHFANRSTLGCSDAQLSSGRSTPRVQVVQRAVCWNACSVRKVNAFVS